MEIQSTGTTEARQGLSQVVGEGTLGKEAFLELLVTQLKNQNPLEPTSNEDMIAQLAQFSSLEEMQNLNENILGLAVLQQSNALLSQLTDSAALIGLSISYLNPATDAEATGVVDSVKMTDEGLAVLSIDGVNVPLANVLEVQGEVTEPDESSGSDDSGGDKDN